MEQLIKEILIPLHPKIVHFPIALLVTASVLEILSRWYKKDSWSHAAFIMYVSALIITPIVVATGIWEQARLNLHHPVLNVHMFFGYSTLVILILSFPILRFLRNTPAFKNVFLIVLLLLSFTVIMGNHYGGKMVYKYGVGVEN
jgi:uncharacterized membrane protein